MNITQSIRLSVLAGAVAMALPMIASAQIKVGITVASTGPAASLGIPEEQTIRMTSTASAVVKDESASLPRQQFDTIVVLDFGTATFPSVGGRLALDWAFNSADTQQGDAGHDNHSHGQDGHHHSASSHSHADEGGTRRQAETD